jgi:dihydrodipicolinate synthase/N-acetylneuraminate lyase
VNYPAGIKAAMEILGRPAGRTRKPIPPLEADLAKRMRAELEKMGILAEEPHGW